MEKTRYIVQLLLIPVWFILFLGLLAATFYLYKLTGSPWAFGLPVYLLPIWWWWTWRGIDKDFDPTNWNSLHDTRLGTFLIFAAGNTVWTCLISAMMLTANDGPLHWSIPLALFVSFGILIVYKMNLREKRRKSLVEHYRSNETALRFWNRMFFVGWLLMVIPAIIFEDDLLLFVPGFLLGLFSIIVMTYLNQNPKRLDSE